VTFALFARAAIVAMQGASQINMDQRTAVLGRSVKGAKERESFLPGSLTTDDGRLIVEPLKWGGSSDFVGFARAAALIHVPADYGVIEAGSLVEIFVLPE